MAVLPIRTVPDPVLRRKSKRIRTVDKSIEKLIADMFDTMYDAPGVGLAASQVGVPIRLIVIGIPDEDEINEIVLINPEIVKKKGERVVDEGCLSVPGYMGQLKRCESVTVKGRDINGKEIRIKADELLAQALEHEIDHINGVLYLDHLESENDLHKVEPKPPEEETAESTGAETAGDAEQAEA